MAANTGIEAASRPGRDVVLPWVTTMDEEVFDLAGCVERVRQHDQAAARLLVDHLYPLVVKIVRGKLPRRDSEEDLMQEIFLLREPGSGTRGLMERLFDDAGLSPRIGMEIDSNETIKQAVIAGLGIALISAHTVASEIEYRRIVALHVEGLPVMRQWFVLRRADKHLLPPAAALMDFLATEAAGFLPAVA